MNCSVVVLSGDHLILIHKKWQQFFFLFFFGAKKNDLTDKSSIKTPFSNFVKNENLDLLWNIQTPYKKNV